MPLESEIASERRWNTWKKIRIGIVLAVVGGGISAWYLMPWDASPSSVEKKIFSTKRSDLRTYVESDGKVFLRESAWLDFPIVWTIRKIHVTEWDSVSSGQVLAELESEYLDINVEKARLALAAAKASYELKRRWSSPDEIRLQKQQIASLRADIEALSSQTDLDAQFSKDAFLSAEESVTNSQKQAEVGRSNAKSLLDAALLELKTAREDEIRIRKLEEEKYRNAIGKIPMEAWQLISQFESNLFDVDRILGISEGNKRINDGYESFLGARNVANRTIAENAYVENISLFERFYAEWKGYKAANNTGELLRIAPQLREIGSGINRMDQSVINVLKDTVDSPAYSAVNIDADISRFEKTLSDNKSALASYQILISGTEEAKSNRDIRIEAEKSSVRTAEQKYTTAQTNYERTILESAISVSNAGQKLEQSALAGKSTEAKNQAAAVQKKADLEMAITQLSSKSNVDATDLEPLRIGVQTAEKNLQEAIERKKDAYLYSAFTWTVSDIAGRVGQTTNGLKVPFVTLIDTNAFFIEAGVEEGEIIKVKDGQEVRLRFDSLEGQTLTGTVTYVNEKANTDANGVVTYEVRIEFFPRSGMAVRDGMSSTIEFVTKEIRNALVVPVSAVKTKDWYPSVIARDGTVRKVSTWFTDGKMVEILEGLKQGDEISY